MHVMSPEPLILSGGGTVFAFNFGICVLDWHGLALTASVAM